MGYDPNAELEKRRKTPTFREFIDEKYIPHVKVYKRSRELGQEMIDRRIVFLWGKMKISEISRDDIREFQSSLIAAGFKPGSINRYMALVKFIFSLAEKGEVIDKRSARVASKLADNNHKERYLTKDETVRLLQELKSCRSEVVPDLIEFLILTGARKGEAANARWEVIDFERSRWTEASKTAGRTGIRSCSGFCPKGKTSRRPATRNWPLY